MKWTQNNLDRFSELLSEKKSLKEIADYFGCSYSTVKWVASNYKLKSKKSGISKSKLNKEREKQKISESSLAKRILFLRGESVRDEAPDFSFSDEQLKSWLDSANGCKLFAKQVLEEELQEYQHELVKGFIKYPRFCLVGGRQVGKDYLAGIYAIWLAVTKPNTKILLVSPAQRQSDLLYNKILHWLASNDQLYFSVERSTQEICNFVNGSLIKSLPSTTFIRGETGVNLVILNEARDFLNGEDVLASTLPMLATVKGHLIMMSSPSGCIGILWDAFNSPSYHSVQLQSNVNKYIDDGWIEEQKQSMPAHTFAMEFEARFQQTIDTYFPADLVESCSERYDLSSMPNSERSYYLGIDWGVVANSSVFTVIGKDNEGHLRVENIIEKIGVPLSAQVTELEALHNRYRFSKVCAEFAGLSLQACQELKAKGLPVDFFKPTMQSKSEI